MAIISDPRPTTATQFLGENHPLLDKQLDVLLGLSLDSDDYRSWPAVLERYQVDRLWLPPGLEIDFQDDLWRKIEALAVEKESMIIIMEPLAELEVEGEVVLRPLVFSEDGFSENEAVGLNVSTGLLRIKLVLAPDSSADPAKPSARSLHLSLLLPDLSSAAATPYSTISTAQWRYLALHADDTRLWLEGVPLP
jgi:hypothetical protein